MVAMRHSAERGYGGPDQDLQKSFHGFSLCAIPG